MYRPGKNTNLSDILSWLLYTADKKSRACYSCLAEKECNWTIEKRIWRLKYDYRSKTFDTEHHTYIMGILNVTPDSFSDGGKYNSLDSALYHAKEMAENGVDIFDIGGESTRPGHIQISDEEEIERVVPIIAKLKTEFDIPISIDTYKSNVAEAAIQAGADLVNDIWGLKYDEKMAGVIAKNQTACCLMHNRDNTEYSNFIEDVLDDFERNHSTCKTGRDRRR